MSTLVSSSTLSAASSNFDSMINNGAVVTVMNARVFKEDLYTASGITEENMATSKAHDVLSGLLDASDTDYVLIKSLKIANITEEGPTKTITGGQHSNPLIKFGKSARLEMQDALCHADALAVFNQVVVETFETSQGSAITTNNTKVIHTTEDFGGPKPILGESFFIDQQTGAQVKTYILIYQFLPDSIFNLTQDAEGDATVFDMNGDLLSTEILIGGTTSAATGITKGVFYSILPRA